ncbi:MAG: hypothetical protein FWE80_07870, partial [Oscillospiraceae bacterium]|nr:hypothetical protein [Oscillospiraceae bacterium]
PLDIHMPDLLKPEQAAPRTAKPARAALYIVEYADITGANDATDAIQEKLDEAAADGGGIVFLPGSPITTSPGRAYRIDGSLTVPTGVELRGAVDIGRIPIKIGTIFRVYGGANQTSAPPTVILQEGAGLRGIIFDYPEQEYVNVANLKSYPYAVQGRGKDIYIVNVSIRNGYNGFDLKTYRCDNHYVEFLAGFCYKNVIQVGGGSTGGFIGNLQFNTGALLNGAESKYGTWPNSPTSANSPNYEARFLNDYTQKNMIFFETSDVVDQVLYNNFSYRGKNGFLFTAENGKAANGWFVGNAIDAAAIGLEFRAIGEMDIINPQVVSLRHGNNTVTEYYHLYTHSSFKDTVNIYNMDCWGVPAAFIRADGGVMNIYNSDYEASTQSNSFTTLGNNGRLNLVGGNTMNRSVNRLVEGAIGNISVKGFFFPVQMSNLTATNAQHWLLWRSAWNTPDNVIFDSFSTLEFVETFRDYPIRTTNGITNVPVVSGSNAGSFNAVSGASANSSVRILNEQAVLSMNEQAARAFFQSSAALMPAGLPNSQYHIELRMNIEQIRSISGDGYSEITISMVMDNVDSIDVATFLRQNFALMADEKLITGWNTNTWYRLGIDIDLRDISAKTYTVTLSDDAYNEIASSDPILFPSEFQDNAFGARGIWLDVAASAGGPAGRTTFVVDYALVTRKMVQKAPTVDRTALEALVNAVKNQANEGFTGLSWNAFTKALQTAQALLNDLGTDQAAVDAAETALESAWKALRKWGFVDTAPNKDRITVTDARLILQYLVEKIDLDPAAYAAAAVNGTVENGAPKVTINDARLVLQYLVEKIDRFPAEH